MASHAVEIEDSVICVFLPVPSWTYRLLKTQRWDRRESHYIPSDTAVLAPPVHSTSQLMPHMPTPQGNHLLAALSAEARNRLSPYLELVSLPLGDAVRHIYFPTDCVISLLYVMENGATAEISVVGNDGLVGAALYLGGEITPSRAVVQSAGSAY